MKPIVDELDEELINGHVADEERDYQAKLAMANRLRERGYGDDHVEEALGFTLRPEHREERAVAVAVAG